MSTIRLNGALYQSFRRVVGWVNDAAALVNELRTDHATFKTTVDGLRTYLSDGLLVHGGLAISAGDATDFKTTATAVYTIAGVTYTKAATDSLSFTAAHVVTAEKFGAILVQINAAGTVSTLVTAETQTTALDHDTEAEAIADLPAPAAGNVALGYILINAEEAGEGHGDWTANTDDMTDASDVLTATFNNTQIKALPAAGPATLSAAAVDDFTFADGTP